MRAILVFCVLLVALLVVNVDAKGAKKAIKKGKKKLSTKSANIPWGYVDGKLCNRPCDGRNMACYFDFKLETFYTMSKACYQCPNVTADCFRQDCIVGGGVQRTVMVINRQMPGPPIEVCQGDRVMVHLENTLQDAEGATIHWHGQHMYAEDKYFDGVPFVTQCPIHANNNFTYEFTCYDPGTHWYHSHVEMQRGDGVYGALICREEPEYNPFKDMYDFDLSEHVILAGDWNDELRLERFERYALAGEWLEPTGILVNGLGVQSSINNTGTPLANFVVQQGSRYRFRFINVGFFDCPLEVSIDGHPMTIITTDGSDLQPTPVNSFVSSSGERFDFIVNANQRVTTYWIRVKGYLTCERLGTFTVATLQYEGSSASLPTAAMPTYNTAAPPPSGNVILNPVSATNSTGYTNVIKIDQLKDFYGIPYGLNTNYPRRFYITVDMSGIDHPVYHRYPYYAFNDIDPNLRVRTPQFNRISFKALDRPLLPERYNINANLFCDEQKVASSNCANNFCECPHVLSVREGEVVEFVFIELFDQDDAPALHPIHLHGYSFYVLGWGELGRNLTKEGVMDLDRRGRLPRNFVRPPLKDTVTVPKGGYTIVRFIADNPGYWFMHCHIDVHASEGMEIVVKVGDNWNMEDAPSNFPRCRNYPS